MRPQCLYALRARLSGVQSSFRYVFLYIQPPEALSVAGRVGGVSRTSFLSINPLLDEEGLRQVVYEGVEYGELGFKQ
jgi:hypothetical protein